MSNQRLLRETELRPVTSIVQQRQLRLYGHVARYLEADPAYRLVTERNNLRWRRPRGRQQSSWLGQVDTFCSMLLGMGRAFAERLALGDHESWRRRVGEAMHPSAYAPND